MAHTKSQGEARVEGVAAIKAQLQASGTMNKIFGGQTVPPDSHRESDVERVAQPEPAQVQEQVPTEQAPPEKYAGETVSKDVFLRRLSGEVQKRRTAESENERLRQQLADFQGKAVPGDNGVAEENGQAVELDHDSREYNTADSDFDQEMQDEFNGQQQVRQDQSAVEKRLGALEGILPSVEQGAMVNVLEEHFGQRPSIAQAHAIASAYREGQAGVSLDEALGLAHERNPGMFVVVPDADPIHDGREGPAYYAQTRTQVSSAREEHTPEQKARERQAERREFMRSTKDNRARRQVGTQYLKEKLAHLNIFGTAGQAQAHQYQGDQVKYAAPGHGSPQKPRASSN